MRIFFISPFCLLRPTTNRIFDVRFCDMMASAGADVTLIHPYHFMKENIDEKDIPKSYGITSPVKFKMLQTPLSNNSPRWWKLTVLAFSLFFVSMKIIFLNRKELKKCFFIGRDNKSLLPIMLLHKFFGLRKINIINTVHEVKKGKLNEWMYKNYDGVLVTTASAKNKLVNDYHVAEAKIERLTSPVSNSNYQVSKEEARKKINYLETNPLVVYTGKLGKGIRELDYIMDAAAALPHYKFILTGGKQEVVNYFENICKDKNIQNVIFPGFMDDSTFISYYQLAADVLVSYYTKEDHMVEYNFPQKLIEYMHTHNPIVTPDFPATHDVINPSNAIIVEPDNIDSFIDGIKKAIENKVASKALALKAWNDVQQFSSEKRAKHLRDFLINTKKITG
jgi:glycosyltransferase involved in cell wall biosynthesis